VFSLTYRQTACLWERYWERKVWDIEVGVITNPMTSFKKEGESSAPSDAIDSTTESGVSQLISMGIPVKVTKV
jgi:hypothetical protein